MVGINWHPILQGLEPEKASFHLKNISKFPYMVFCSGMPRSASRLRPTVPPGGLKRPAKSLKSLGPLRTE